MAKRPALSKGEMDVARVLWDIGPATVRAIHEAMVRDKAIDFATVQTYLRRLDTKGYVSSKLVNRVRVYSAKAKPKTVIRETVDELVERMFGGESMPLVKHLIEDRNLGSDEISELKALIDRLDSSNKRSDT